MWAVAEVTLTKSDMLYPNWRERTNDFWVSHFQGNSKKTEGTENGWIDW